MLNHVVAEFYMSVVSMPSAYLCLTELQLINFRKLFDLVACFLTFKFLLQN